MSPVYQQLPLALQLRDDATFNNFFAADNQLLLDQLKDFLSNDERYLYLYGAAGSGRSHLLQALCHSAGEQHISAVYFPLKDCKDYPPEELFDGLEAVSLICLDDVDAVIGSSADNRAWEQALFNLFNRLQANGGKLLVSANSAVRELPLSLADLASRLSWGSVFRLNGLSESQLVAMVVFRADLRGLELSDEVAQFIYHRCQRDTYALIDILDRLDKASLREQRRLTIPFVKVVLG